MSTDSGDSRETCAEPQGQPLFLLPGEASGKSIGGKARGLLELFHAGLETPPWVVIPAEAVAARAWEAPGAMQQLEVQLASWADTFDGIAVRSSALGEDSAAASYAGVFLTEFVERGGEVAGAIARVAASAARATEYRRHAAHAPPPMAIVVQAAVRGLYSGAAFSAAPAAARYDQAYIESVDGPGSKLVDGTHTPSVFRIAREDARALETRPGADGPQTLPCGAVESLLAGLKALEDRANALVELEWTQTSARLYFLQVRPITALALDPAELPGECHTSYFFDQRFTRPISPFSRSTLLPLIASLALGEALHMRGHAEPASLRYYGGQAYVPHRVWKQMLSGAPRWWLSEDLRQLFPDACYCDAQPAAPAAPILYAGDALAAVLKHRADVFSNLRQWDTFLAELEPALEHIPRHPGSAGEFRQTWEQLDALTARFLALHRWSLLWADYLYRAYRLVLASMPGGARASLGARLRNSLRLKTVQANEALLQFSQGELSLSEFAARYGHRSASLDYAEPTWAELAAEGAFTATASPASRSVPRDTAPIPLPLRPVWTVLCRFLELREEQRFNWEKILAVQRGLVMHQAQLLTDAGRLPAPGDVWLLSLDEMLALAFDPEADAPADLAERRHAIRLEALVRKPPFIGPSGASLAATPPERIIRGVAASAGRAFGRAVHLTNPAQIPRTEEPIIGVLVALDPAWTPLMHRVAGLVVERGGLLSHAAVVAREYELPLVIGVADVFARIPDGASIELDGTLGEIMLPEPSLGDPPRP